MGVSSRRVLARFRRAKSDKKKRMVVMMGPPAAGKGFFLGEPPPKYGWKLPQMLVDDAGKPLLTDDDIPERPAQDESDNHLRAIQFEEARGHFEALKAAHQRGEDQFKSAVADHWYATKDGGRVELGSVLDAKEFPENFKDYFAKTNKDFYVSMRGWHDDAKEVNEVTGKPKERFKDEARHRFDESVARKVEQVEDMLIVDSAGEDIDAQDYKGQIDQAKQHGYEVTVIFLHPEQADTELSNLARGKVMGKRMVDQADISNWYERNADALKDIQAAAPDNFVHYRKGPPDPDPAKAAEMRGRAREMMNKLQGLEGQEQEAAKKEINKILYGAAPYKLNKATSYGVAVSGLPKEPEEESIADAVSKMNDEAQRRAAPEGQEETKSTPSKRDDDTKSQSQPAKKDEKKSKTRLDFLREMGDKKVSNPNPESRDRHPQIKIRSLPWTYQQTYYEQWSQRAAAQRVVGRYLSACEREVYRRFYNTDSIVRHAIDLHTELPLSKVRVVKMAGSSWVAEWMSELADEIGKIKVEDYEVKAEAGKGPVVSVTLVGASEDATAARKARQKIEQVMKASIKKNADGIPGFDSNVRSFNKGADVVLECTVQFP